MWSGPASLYVLVALADGPAHGLGIADNVASFTEGTVLLGPGTLYRVLRDLYEEGLIERADPPGEDHPHRKYYRITRPGRERLSSAVDELRRVVATAGRRMSDPVTGEA